MNEHLELAIRILNTIRETSMIAAENRWTYELLSGNMDELEKHILKDNIFKPIDLSTFTVEDFQKIGSLQLHEGDTFMMIPSWILPYCDKNIDVYNINGVMETAVKLCMAETNSKFGYITYAVKARDMNRIVTLDKLTPANKFMV